MERSGRLGAAAAGTPASHPRVLFSLAARARRRRAAGALPVLLALAGAYILGVQSRKFEALVKIAHETGNPPLEHELLLPQLPPLVDPPREPKAWPPSAWTVTSGKGKVKSTVCWCAKCDSSSVTIALYEILLGKHWSYEGPPWVQEMSSVRWEGVASRKSEWESFNEPSYAVIRDPKERIVSAFRSKISCSGWHVDEADRAKMVPNLFKLANMSTTLASKPLSGDGLCMTEEVYLNALLRVHTLKLQGELNEHFKPQHLNCFLHTAPSQWTVVTTARSAESRCLLEAIVLGHVHPRVEGNNSTGESCSFRKPHGNSVNNEFAMLSDVNHARLDAITREEYQVIGPYLS